MSTILNESDDLPVLSPLQHHMILLVDDQAIVAEAVRRFLSNLRDVDFHYCPGSAEALMVARHIRPTVILQDLVMPGMDGMELLRRYRADPVLAEVPVIVLSTKEDPKVKGEAFTGRRARLSREIARWRRTPGARAAPFAGLPEQTATRRSLPRPEGEPAATSRQQHRSHLAQSKA